MRALLISSSIPPVAESQSIRNVFLLKGLCGAGWDVDVIAPPLGKGDESLLRQIPDRVTIHRAGPSTYDRIQSWIGRIPSPLVRNTLRGVFARLAGVLLVPDVRCGWDRNVIQVAKTIGGEFDLIVSSAGSNTAHLAASALARQWGVPWIAEYGDPWSLNPLAPAKYWHNRARNSRLERAALRYCSAITVTTESTAAAMNKWIGTSCPPIEVIPCGYSTAKPCSTAPAPHNGIVVSYIGTASRGSRDLRSIMVALDKAAVTHGGKETVTFRMVGSTSPAFENKGRELRHLTIQSRGWVSYEESLELMGSSDLLLLVGNRQSLQVPAKLFNYIAAERPILYYGQAPPEVDGTHAILSRLPGVVVLNSAQGSLEDQLEKALSQSKQLLEASQRRLEPAWIRAYAWENIAGQFGALASGLLVRKPAQ